jgi:DNA-directed RNA polymerase subunit H (RpoH/RPB5)
MLTEWNHYENLIKLIAYRGMKIIDPKQILSEDAFNRTILVNKFVELTCSHVRNGSEKETCGMFLFGDTDIPMKKKTLEAFIDARKKLDAICLIVEEIKPIHTEYRGMHGKKYVEIFINNKIIINFPEHKLISKHVLLSYEEFTHEFKENVELYHFSEGMIPIILVEDTMAIWVGARVNEYVKIFTRSENVGMSIKYKIAKW